MKTVLCLLVVVLSCLWNSSALALALLGPPKAELKQNQRSLGFVFASSEMDIEVSGYGLSETLPDIESKTYLARAGYGLFDGCELYALFGLSDTSTEDYNGSSEFAWGLGTKFTVAQKDSVTWGGLFQLCGIRSEDSVSGDVPGYGWQTIDLDIDLFDIRIAFGPAYTQGAFSIYGGPFLHFIEGDMDVSLLGVTGTVDLKQESEFGGYAGVQLDLAESSSLFFEYQMTGDASAIAGGLIWRF